MATPPMLLLALLLGIEAPLLPYDASAPEGAVAPQVFADGTYVIATPLHAGPGGLIVFRNATVYLDHRLACGVAACSSPQILLEGGTLEVHQSRVATTRADPFVISGDGGQLILVDSTVERHGGIVMKLAGAPSLVRNTTFLDSAAPLTFARGANAEVRDNRFFGGTAGVSARDASPTIVANHFRGIRAPGTAINVEVSVAGEKVYETLARVEDNLVEESWRGMLQINGYPNVVARNTFRANLAGLLVGVTFGDEFEHRASPRLEGNVFTGNNVSFVAGLAGNTDRAPTVILDARGNDFLDARCVHILEQSHPDGHILVDATQGWWGSASGPIDVSPSCPAVTSANILVAPWRSSR